MLLVACLAAGLSWAVLIRAANQRTALVTVWVAGGVDEMAVYSVDAPDSPLLTIQTRGEDAFRAFELVAARDPGAWIPSDAALYTFTIVSGGESVDAGVFCCQTGLGLEQISITVRGLEDYEVSGR